MHLLYRYREFIRNLVLKDLKLKYRDSVLGFLWSLMNPLLLILVYGFVFGHLFRGGLSDLPYFLMVGILPWNFFAQSLMMATGSILDNGNLIRKVALPMEVFPIATVLFNLAQYVLALLVFFPMALLFFKVSVAWSWILFVPILALHILFTVGVCLMASTATVFYRDVRHFVEILLMLLFWLTPVVYDIRAAAAPLRSALYMNPLSYFILSYQEVLYYNAYLSLSRLGTIIALTACSLAVGCLLFVKCKKRFAEEV